MIVSGPLVVVHDQACSTPYAPTMALSERSTKAEILAHLRSLQAQQASGPSWPAIWAKLIATGQTIARESTLLVRDVYQAGALARQWVSVVVDELSRPVLRSKT